MPASNSLKVSIEDIIQKNASLLALSLGVFVEYFLELCN